MRKLWLSSFSGLWLLLASTLVPVGIGLAPALAQAESRSATCIVSRISTDTDGYEIKRARIHRFRPTQFALGMREVDKRVDKLEALSDKPKKLKRYLKRNPIPVVLGPDEERYMIDHHHLLRTLHKLEHKKAYYAVVGYLSHLNENQFWREMKKGNLIWLRDEKGRGPLKPEQLPRTIEGLKNDPYRALASAVCDAGGYRKTTVPFAQFFWADFFRTRIRIKPGRHGFEEAVARAVRLAQSPEAKSAELPGYSRTR